MTYVLHKGVLGLQTESIQLYANSATGDDRNSGLASDDAKETLGGLFAIVPKSLEGNITLNLSGNFIDQYEYLHCVLSHGIIAIDGGANRVKKTGTNDSYTSTTTSVSLITDSTQSWTTDEYAGWWVEILSGSNGTTGDVRTIQKNDSNTLYTAQDFSGDPVAGATFRICRPETAITGSSTYAGIRMSIVGGTNGNVVLQRMYFDGRIKTLHSAGTETTSIQVQQCITNNSYDHTSMNTWGAHLLQFTNFFRDPVAYTTSYYGPGCGFVGEGELFISNVPNFYITSSYFRKLRLSCCNVFEVSNGARFNDVEFRNVQNARLRLDEFTNTAPTIRSSSGFANVLFTNSAGDGLILTDCNLTFGANVEFSNNGGHGLNIENSHIRIYDVVSGSGNSGAGLYAHDGSDIQVKDGITPTLTGSVGDISTDGTTEAISWAAVDAGSKYVDNDEETLIKEVA